MADSIGPVIKITGEAEFKKAINELNTSFKTLGTEMSAVTSAFDKNDKGSKALTAQNVVLNKQIDTQKDKLVQLNSGLALSTEKYGAADKVTQGWQQQVNTATAALNKMDAELKSNDKSIALQNSNWTKLGKSLDDIGSKMKTVGAGLSSAGKSMTVGLTAPILGAVAGLGALVMKSSATADELQKLSDVTGLSAERLQELKYAGSALGVDLETITGAQAKLTKAMLAAKDASNGVTISLADQKLSAIEIEKAQSNYNEALKKNGKNSLEAREAAAKLQKIQEDSPAVLKGASEAFASLGISVVDGNGNLRDAKDVMGEAFTALKGVGNETERDAMAMAIFGKSGMALNPIIKAGGAELTKLTDEARKNGAVMSNESVAGLDSFGDSLDAMKLSISGAVGEAASKLMPIFEKLTPIIQEKIVPAIGKFVQTIADLIVKFTTLDPGTQKLILGFGAFLLVIGPIVTVVGSIVTAVGGIATAFGAVSGAIAAAGGILAVLTGPIAIIIAAVVGLIAVGVLLYKNWDTVSAFLSETWDSIATTATNVFNGIATFFTDLWTGITTTTQNTWNGIGTFFTNVWAGIQTTTEAVWNGIKDFFATVWNGIVTVVMSIVNPFISGITNLFDGMKNGLTTIFEGLKMFFSGVWEAIKLIFLGPILLILDLVTGNFTKLDTDAQKIFNGLKDAFSAIWNGIKLIFTGTVDAIVGFLSTAWTGIKTTATMIWNGLKDFFTGLWDDIKTAATKAWDGLKSAVSTIMTNMVNGEIAIFNGILDFFRGLPTTLYDLGVSIFTSLKNGISSILDTLGTVVSTGFNTAITFITDLPGKALQWGKDFITGFTDGITNAMNGLKAKVQEIADSIRSFLHFSTPDQGPLADYESWMPDFMSGLADGITKSKWMVTDAVRGLSTDMSIGVSANMMGGNVSGGAGSGKAIQQTVNIYSPTALSPSEVSRQLKRTLQEMAFEF